MKAKKVIKKAEKKIPLQNVPVIVDGITQPNFEHAKRDKHARRAIDEFSNANNPI